MIRIAIIDSFPVFVDEIERQVEKETDMQIVGVCSKGSDAYNLVRNTSPDVIILGMNLDNQLYAYYPVVAVKSLRQDYPKIRVLMHTDKAIMVRELIEVGVTGYVLKDDCQLAHRFADGIRAVYNNQFFLFERIQRQLAMA